MAGARALQTGATARRLQVGIETVALELAGGRVRALVPRFAPNLV
ncbi:MAG: hypothetical protein ACJ8BW_14250 [Ktedonobacteraceae bacterium]